MTQRLLGMTEPGVPPKNTKVTIYAPARPVESSPGPRQRWTKRDPSSE